MQGFFYWAEIISKAQGRKVYIVFFFKYKFASPVRYRVANYRKFLFNHRGHKDFYRELKLVFLCVFSLGVLCGKKTLHLKILSS
jgi:hypothetical protein